MAEFVAQPPVIDRDDHSGPVAAAGGERLGGGREPSKFDKRVGVTLLGGAGVARTVGGRLGCCQWIQYGPETCGVVDRQAKGPEGRAVPVVVPAQVPPVVGVGLEPGQVLCLARLGAFGVDPLAHGPADPREHRRAVPVGLAEQYALHIVLRVRAGVGR